MSRILPIDIDLSKVANVLSGLVKSEKAQEQQPRQLLNNADPSAQNLRRTWREYWLEHAEPQDAWQIE